MITPTSPPEQVHPIYRAPWYPVAAAVVATGHDCTVLDPDATEDEAFHDGDPNHGVIRVRCHVALGWTVVVSECEPDTEDEP